MRHFLTAVAVHCLVSTLVFGGPPPTTAPTVQIELAPDHKIIQPTGMPVIVYVTLTNIGSEPFTWQCIHPDLYPGGHEFIVERYMHGDDRWAELPAINGQHHLGMRSFQCKLDPGEDIVVPLAIAVPPMNDMDDMLLRIRLRQALPEAAAKVSLNFDGRRPWIDPRRAQIIAAVLAESPDPFWQRVAEEFPDPVVNETMLRMILIDNVPIASRAARVLARQDALPESAGEALAEAVQRWLPAEFDDRRHSLRIHCTEAALKTRSEPARTAVLRTLRELDDPDVQAAVIEALRHSPGDVAWLERVKNAVIAVEASEDKLRKVKTRTMEWLDVRIRNHQRGLE